MEIYMKTILKTTSNPLLKTISKTLVASLAALTLAGAPAFAADQVPAAKAEKVEKAENKAQTRVSLNKAGVSELAGLKGVGEKKAKAIVAYREQHGPFTTVDDLVNVKGIGEKTVAANKARLML